MSICRRFMPVSAAVLCAVVLSVCAACALNPEVVTVWGGDAEVPKLERIEPVSAGEVRAVFSAPVSVSNAEIAIPDTPGAIITTSWESGIGDNSIVFLLDEPVGVGVSAALSATVADGKGNSLAFSVPFAGYNDHPAKMCINEVRMNYSKPKVEFIEFIVLEAGNLGGMEIFNAMNKICPSYEFPPVEVSAGDYVVYHLRSIEEGLVNETGAINASAGTDSRPDARDFWDTQTRSPMKETNVLLLRERKNGAIEDAVLYAEPGTADWPNDTVKAAATLAVSSGSWKPNDLIANAASTDECTATHTLCRDALSVDTDTAADWAICVKSKCTPGAVNGAR